MPLRVLYLDPYHGPSHGALSNALREHSRHAIQLLTLSPRKWKWRMRGAAFALEPQVRALEHRPDVLVATDMLNLPEFLALVRDMPGERMPVITYFHENQITYPLPRRDERDFHFGLANIYTALASDRVVFNSDFHREEFLGAVPDVLRLMPDHRPEGIPARIRARSAVLGVPIEAQRNPAPGAGRENLILWNHRWEEDKDPEAFFRVMETLDARGADFRLMVLGQSFREQPGCFERARRKLSHRIAHWGWMPDRASYLEAVARCRVVVSTARHEFYGLAVREAIAAGCYPLLPHRVVYPEMVGHRAEHLWKTEEDLVGRLETLLSGPAPAVDPALREGISALTPRYVAARWDEWFDALG